MGGRGVGGDWAAEGNEAAAVPGIAELVCFGVSLRRVRFSPGDIQMAVDPRLCPRRAALRGRGWLHLCDLRDVASRSGSQPDRGVDPGDHRTAGCALGSRVCTRFRVSRDRAFPCLFEQAGFAGSVAAIPFLRTVVTLARVARGALTTCFRRGGTTNEQGKACSRTTKCAAACR